MMHDCAFETETQEPKDHLIDALFCVPTFYSYTIVPCGRFIFGICISVLFGAIHGNAWYYKFSSSPEMGVENIIHCHISGTAHALVDVRGLLGGARYSEFINFLHLPWCFIFVIYLFEDSAPYFSFNSPSGPSSGRICRS